MLKDIIVKAKTLSGLDAPYVPGWDCHGLPIEHNVEKKIGKAGVKVEYATFRQRCRDYAAQQVAGQKVDFIRLGVLGDWDNPYLTMDFKTEADTIRALGRITPNGLFPAAAPRFFRPLCKHGHRQTIQRNRGNYRGHQCN